MNDIDLQACLEGGSIRDIGSQLRARRFSVAEAVGFYLARIEALDRTGPALNAVRESSARALDDARASDAALGAGRDLGPLHGIPVLLKDNVLAHGMSAAAGAAALAKFRPEREATLVRRLRRAGAIILGKTNLTEFADYVSDVMPSGFSGAGGVVRNPHGIEYGRGQGSSVGSAASVAASLAPAAIGSETQNSIQTPASFSSVVGYKPSVGAVSRHGLVPLVPSQDSPGPLARSVADALLIASAIAGPDPRDTATLAGLPGIPSAACARPLGTVRIGVPRRQMAGRPEFATFLPLFEAALEALGRAGATLVDPCDLPSAEALQEARSSVFRTEFKAALNAMLEDLGAPCGIGSLQELIRWNEAHPEAIPYGQSLLMAAESTAGLDDPGYRADRARDLALSLDGGIKAALASCHADVLIAPMGAAAKCTGKAGAPAISIPAGADAGGTPFGVTLFAAPGDDGSLLSIALAVESALQGRRLPRLSPGSS
jgi:amidase